MSQYMPQPNQQIPMQAYNNYAQQPMQMPQMAMPQPGMDANMQRYITDMRQRLDDYERRFAPTNVQQYIQPQTQNQPTSPQEATQYALLAVASMDEAQNHPPDISGKLLWFVNKDTNEVYSKHFNVKTAELKFYKHDAVEIDLNTPQTSTDAAVDPQKETVDKSKQDTIKRLEDKIEALEKKQQEMEAKLNDESINGNDDRKSGNKSDADASTEHAPGVSTTNGDGKRGPKPKPNNRNGNAEKPTTSTDTVGTNTE